MRKFVWKAFVERYKNLMKLTSKGFFLPLIQTHCAAYKLCTCYFRSYQRINEIWFIVGLSLFRSVCNKVGSVWYKLKIVRGRESVSCSLFICRVVFFVFADCPLCLLLSPTHRFRSIFLSSVDGFHLSHMKKVLFAKIVSKATCVLQRKPQEEEVEEAQADIGDGATTENESIADSLANESNANFMCRNVCFCESTRRILCFYHLAFHVSVPRIFLSCRTCCCWFYIFSQHIYLYLECKSLLRRRFLFSSSSLHSAVIIINLIYRFSAFFSCYFLLALIFQFYM